MSEAVVERIALDDRSVGLDRKIATERRHGTKRSTLNLAPLPLLLITMLAPPAAAPLQAREVLSRDVYAAADRSRLAAAQVRNLRVDPVWQPDGHSFWYRRDTPDGARWIAVDPLRRSRTDAFDASKLSAALAAMGAPNPAGPPRLDGLAFAKDGRIEFSHGRQRVRCALGVYRCEPVALRTADPLAAVSPDGRRAVFARDHDLWLRDLATGAERRLTTDGEAYFAYGKYPDAGLLTVLASTRGLRPPLTGIAWSPDSRHVLVKRQDERALKEYGFLQLLPGDGSRRPRLIPARLPILADPLESPVEVSMLDVETGTQRRVAVGSHGVDALLSWWSTDGSRVLTVQGGHWVSEIVLWEISVSGSARRVLVEKGAKFVSVGPLMYDEPAIRYLSKTNEMIWYSQRDDWGRLYLVDVATGRIKRALTPAGINLAAIVKVDERARRLWFAAAGADTNPYHRNLYSVSLDGGESLRLTPADGDHEFDALPDPHSVEPLRAIGAPVPMQVDRISPRGEFFVDTASTVERAPRTVLRDARGREVMVLETADVSALEAARFVRAEAFVAKAADGRTNLHGVLLRPAGFDPSKRYPVVDAIYNGPQVVTTPHNFARVISASSGGWQSFAQLGFVVVIVDSRGTPLRTKEFQDYIHGNFEEFGLEDHVAVLKQVAATRPWMDLDRLGIYGHSFGGYAAMKGILSYPDFFRAASASAGPYDWYGMYPISGVMPEPLFANGTGRPSSPSDMPVNWGAADLTKLAGQLRGHLQIAYGDLDENALPATTARMVNALIAANKDFELLYMPNRGHGFREEPYFIRRRWDFFVRTLMDRQPPREYTLNGR